MIKNILILLVIFLISFSTFNFFSNPIVYVTYPDKMCVWVDSEEQAYDCTNLPDRYHIRYTSPKYNNNH